MILTWRWPPTIVLRRALREMGEIDSSDKSLNTINSAGGGGE